MNKHLVYSVLPISDKEGGFVNATGTDVKFLTWSKEPIISHITTYET